MLLAAIDATPPYILVGHSIGGIFIRTFVALYPQDVAGLVYVDGSHPTVPLQNVGDRVTCQFVTQVGEGTLDSQISQGLVFRSETDNKRGNLHRRPADENSALSAALLSYRKGEITAW